MYQIKFPVAKPWMKGTVSPARPFHSLAVIAQLWSPLARGEQGHPPFSGSPGSPTSSKQGRHWLCGSA